MVIFLHCLGKLFAPEFNLSSSPNTVKVKIYRKPFLNDFLIMDQFTLSFLSKGQESQVGF